MKKKNKKKVPLWQIIIIIALIAKGIQFLVKKNRTNHSNNSSEIRLNIKE